MCQDLVFQYNTVEVEDDPIGLIDDAKETKYLQLYDGYKFFKSMGSDSMNKRENGQSDMVYYWNMILSREGSIAKK